MKSNTIETIQTAIDNLKETLENLMLNEQDLNLMIHNRAELNYILECLYLAYQDEAYADEIWSIIERDGEQEPILFLRDEEKNNWHAYQCTHECRKIPFEEIPEFVAYYHHYSEYSYAWEMCKAMYRDGVQHKISCYGSAPFLDGEFKIVRILSEVECLDWILAYEKEHQITDIKEFHY